MKDSLLNKINVLSETYLGDERHIDVKAWLAQAIPLLLTTMHEQYSMLSNFSFNNPDLDDLKAKEKWNKLLQDICFQFEEAEEAFGDSDLIDKFASAQKEYLKEHGTLNGFKEDPEYRDFAIDGKGELQATIKYNDICLKKGLKLLFDNIDYLTSDMDV